MPLSTLDIAHVCKARLIDVEANWPCILNALDCAGIRTDLVEIAVSATVAVETAHLFRPIDEFGGEAYWTRMYEHRKDLGNIMPGDGALFHGRGYIQITGRANYRDYGLEEAPEVALQPDRAADILADYFRDRGVAKAANRSDWRDVRRRVNGGFNGWEEFKRCVEELLPTIMEVAH